MAAWAETTTIKMVKAIPVFNGIGILMGRTDITNYHQTNVAIPEITGKFKTIFGVLAGPTDNGYRLTWHTNTFKAWISHTAAADDQVATDTDVGEAWWIAWGLV